MIDALFEEKTLASSNLTGTNNKKILDPNKISAIKGTYCMIVFYDTNVHIWNYGAALSNFGASDQYIQSM